MSRAVMRTTITIKGPIEAGVVPGPEHFEVLSEPTPESAPPGGLLLQSLVLSADPYLRGGCKTVEAGAPMSGFVAGKVLESNHASWTAGDLFGGSLPFSNVNVVTGEAMDKTLLWKLTGLCAEEDISQGVGVLGMPGSTAYGE
jgi:NADPH-dependent curcumin reductase CurA